jgi:hypothetical protein
MMFCHVVYGMQAVTKEMFDEYREDFKVSVDALYGPIVFQSYIPNFIKIGLFSVFRAAPVKHIDYSDEQIKFASILHRFFSQDSQYQTFIENFNFEMKHQIYITNIVADLEFNDSWSESELINEFRKELIDLCNISQETSIEQLCAMANEPSQMDDETYMTHMTLNLFVRYWLQKQGLI